MKKIILTLMMSSLAFLNVACSGTWEGIKNDTSNAWESTKQTIHEATK